MYRCWIVVSSIKCSCTPAEELFLISSTIQIDEGRPLAQKKGKFPSLPEWLISSDIVENQNSLSASPEQESQMEPGLENEALLFLPRFSLECLVWEDK